MKQITLVCFDSAFSSAITGLLDLFSLVGVTWNRIHRQSIEPHFQVRLASPTGNPVRCLNNLSIQPDVAIGEAGEDDIIFIPPIGGEIERVLQREAVLVEWLREEHTRGASIAGSCTGTFLVAESGLLNGRVATTHWGYVDRFRQRYPEVILKPEKLITRQANLFCAGGGSAWLDLALLLVEDHLGHEIAVQTAKALVIERKQQSQEPYTSLQGRKLHQDPTILTVQEWMESNLERKIQVDRLGDRYGMSPRNFKRRFKQATGETPLVYLQSLRIEAGKHYLESTRLPIERITQLVGYQDSGFFVKLFKRRTGLSPAGYRNRFRQGDQAGCSSL